MSTETTIRCDGCDKVEAPDCTFHSLNLALWVTPLPGGQCYAHACSPACRVTVLGKLVAHERFLAGILAAGARADEAGTARSGGKGMS